MNAQLVLENVSVRLPNRVLFEEINWTLFEGQRVTLAGRNGCGKSTLMKILAGQLEPTTGSLTVVGGKRLRIGYLDQSLLDSAVLHSKSHGNQSRSCVELLKTLLDQNPVDEDDLHLDREWEIRKMLSGLGFSDAYMDGPISSLSGGWLLRVFVAKALLDKPDVLLLDEPTNHLDMSSIQWLEEFLQKEYRGSLILITHDVSLQKRTTDSLAVIHGAKFFFRSHQNDYLTFCESLGEEKRLLRKRIEELDKKIGENMEFVYKFRAKAQTAARAQSKLKMAEDFQAEKKDVIERLQRVEGFANSMSLRYRFLSTGSKFPMSAKNLSFRYDEFGQWIIKDVTTDIKRGDKIAILGDNGAGKTTLLNLLAERLKPSEGEVSYGHNIVTGYFGQHQLDELDLQATVMDNLRDSATGLSFEQVRGWLGSFGFCTNDEIEKEVRVLSGGERARLAMLRCLVRPLNLSLLDEPTNHLDIETKEILKNAIKDFEGTAIFVSHDREFVAALADRIIYLTTDHRLIDHLGNLQTFFEKYPEFLRHVESNNITKAASAPKSESKAPGSHLNYEERKKVKNQIKSLEKKLATNEMEMEQLGKEKAALEAKTQDTAFLSKASSDEKNQTYQRISALDAAINSKMVEWEKWSTDLAAAQKLFGISPAE